MQVALISSSGSEKELPLADSVFGCHFNEPLIHQVVTSYLAGARQGTRGQKKRSAVSGGGKKPWKQKGMGRARAGTIRSPLWRSGGVTFAAKPQDHSCKVNKKMYRVAMRSILSELIRQERLVALDELNIEGAKTRHLLSKLAELNLTGKTLIITDEVQTTLYFAARNLFKVTLSDVEGLNPVDLINHEKILITAAALKQIEELLA